MKKLIVFLMLVGVCYAGDYKSCVIKYKTDAGLCRQIERVLNTVDTLSGVTYSGVLVPIVVISPRAYALKDIDNKAWYVGNNSVGDTIWADSCTTIGNRRIIHRQYRGLTVVSEPVTKHEIDWDNDGSKWRSRVFYPGKAILIWEEVEK